jgi:hypothetical protein
MPKGHLSMAFFLPRVSPVRQAGEDDILHLMLPIPTSKAIFVAKL